MFTIGIDCGASLVRALVVRRGEGDKLGGAVVGYPSGDEGAPLDEGDHHHIAPQPSAGLLGELRLPIGTRGVVR